MTVLGASALLTLTVVGGATFTPWLLRHATPALTRAPRLATALWVGSVSAWLLAVLAIGPMLAWMLSGPTVLAGAAAELCQRCLDLTNPFAGPILHTPIPAPALLAMPALVAAGVVLSATRTIRQERAATRASARALLVDASRERICGHDVWQVPDRRPFAIAYPRHTGIVVSAGALGVLTSRELTAVLAHEQAHLTQRHHGVRTVLDALAVALRWVPLVTAAADAVSHYLEIAADDAARRQVGTTTLAGALLKLGEATPAPSRLDEVRGVLHAAGPDRIRHLVAPARAGASTGPAGISVLLLGAIAATSAAVHLPYLHVIVTGCT